MHTSHYSRLEEPNIPIATQVRLPRIYYTVYILWYMKYRAVHPVALSLALSLCHEGFGFSHKTR